MMTDYRPSIAATVKPALTHIDSVLQDMCDAEALSGLDFTSRHRRIPFHESSHHLYASITTDSVIQTKAATKAVEIARQTFKLT